MRRGALIALDQMEQGKLTLDLVLPLFDAGDPELRQASATVAARHPEWAGSMADSLRRWLEKGGGLVPPAVLRRQLVAFSSNPAIQVLIAELVERRQTPAPTRVLLLEVMALAQPDQWPVPWLIALRNALTDRDEEVARHAVATVRANYRLTFGAPLCELCNDRTRGRDLRLEALDAVAPRLAEVEPPLFEFLISQLDPAELPLRRLVAARALGRAPLNDGQLLALTRVVGVTGASSLPLLLPVREHRQPKDRKRGLRCRPQPVAPVSTP